MEIVISYDDPSTPAPIGSFKNIIVNATLQESYLFTPSRNTVVGALAALYISTGQILIGDAREASRMLGSWRFSPSEAYLSPTRIAEGLINVQYIAIGDRLLSGIVKLREGANVSLTVDTVGDESIVTIDVDNTSSSIVLTSDADVIAALTNEIGQPIRSINGLLPDVSRNFVITGEDCTDITPQATGITIGNPCATPCCPEDQNITSIKESIEALNLKYADLFRIYEVNRDMINDVQNRLLSLGNTL